MIKFRKMTDDEFVEFRESTIRSFSAANVTAGNWDEEPALGRAEGMLAQLLPGGKETPYHRFMTVSNEKNDVGTLWIFVDEVNRKAFLFDIEIFREFRGTGCGKDTMDEMEKMLAAEGVQQIELHVFGHNEPARSLYLKKGYLETDVTMRKNL